MSIHLTEIQKQDVKNCLQEISVLMSKQEQLKEQIAAVYDTMKDGYQIEKKVARKLAKTYHKRSFEEETAVFQEFDELYNTVVGADA